MRGDRVRGRSRLPAELGARYLRHLVVARIQSIFRRIKMKVLI